MTYSDHCDVTSPSWNDGHSSPHTDTCSQNFTNSSECGGTYHVNTGLSWTNAAGECGSYFVDYGSCQPTPVAFSDVPWYDHTNSPWYDHNDIPFYDHSDVPFYDHDDVPAHTDYVFENYPDGWCNCQFKEGDEEACYSDSGWQDVCGAHVIPGFFSNLVSSHYNASCKGGEHFDAPQEGYGTGECLYVDSSGSFDDTYPHDHWYNYYFDDPGDLGHSDRAHSHSYTGTNIPDQHYDEPHDHWYDCGFEDDDCDPDLDRGHAAIAHSHSYSGSGTGHYDIDHAHTPHVNFCNHSNAYSGDCS